MKKRGEHHLTQVIKFNLSSKGQVHDPLVWCAEDTASPVLLLPKSTQNPTKDVRQTQLERHLQKQWPALLKNVSHKKMRKDWGMLTTEEERHEN